MRQFDHFPFSYNSRENEFDDEEENFEHEDSLPFVMPPYLPVKNEDDKIYTLVLDLDETLIHFEDVKITLF